MDKVAANNHFVTLRKEVKKAKAMVCGNLIRKISKLKKVKEKFEDETQMKKLDYKIANALNEVKLIKTLDSYIVAKKATLEPDATQWDKVISDCKVTAEDRATARLIVKNNVQKQVLKFRSDFKDCDEWLNEYIEFREKKRELKETNTRTFKRKENNDRGKKIGIHKRKKENTCIAVQAKDDRQTSKTQSHEAKIHSGETSAPKTDDSDKTDTLHPSWEVKKKENMILKAAFSGEVKPATRITFDT